MAVRGLVQRVSEASVTSAESADDPPVATGSIAAGIVLFVGVTHGDDEAAAVRLADKVYNLRIFASEVGPTDASCADIGGQVLVVPQFTLYADTRKGRRPSFIDAATPEVAETLVEQVGRRLTELGATVATGRFRTHMQVSLVNDGPFTLMLEV